MSRTDLKTPPANPHKHDHGLTQVDTVLAGKAATTHTHPVATHTHPEIAALTTRVTALEARVAALETKPPLPTVPPAPANLKAVAGNRTVTLTWSLVP